MDEDTGEQRVNKPIQNDENISYDEFSHYMREEQKAQLEEEKQQYGKQIELDDYKKLSIKEQYMHLANRVSYNNVVLNESLFHVLVSLLLRGVRIKKDVLELDSRIHLINLQATRTGKGNACNFFLSIVKEFGLKIHRPTDWSDAGLLGKIETVTEKVKNEISNRWEQRKTSKIVYGSFKDCDLFYQPEANELFKPTRIQWKQNTVNYINVSLDTIGENQISKKLSSEKEIKFCPKFCAVLSSQFYSKISEDTARSGFLQRFIFLPRTISPKERVKNAILDSERSTSFSTESINLYEAKKQILVKNLKGIKSYSDKIEKTYLPETLREELDRCNEEMFRYIEPCSDNTKIIISEFISGYFNLLIRLVVQNAILEKRRVPTKEDVEKSKKFLKKIFNYIITWVEEDALELIRRDQEKKGITDHTINRMRRIFKSIEGKNEGGFLTTREFSKRMSRELNLSEATINQIWIPRLKSSGYLLEIKDGVKVFKKLI